MYRPMLARTSPEPFDDPEWLFEPKWDGYRALLETGKGTVRLFGRRSELTSRFPEFAQLPSGGVTGVLDGEIIAIGGDGRPDFYALSRVDRRLRYVAFDLLEEGGRPLLREPLIRRRELLETVLRAVDDSLLMFSRGWPGEGEAFFRAVVDLDLEGMMAKKLASPYLPGERSSTWLKVLNGKEIVVSVPWVEETAAHEWVALAVEGKTPRGHLRLPRPEIPEGLLMKTAVLREGRRFCFTPPLRAEVRFRELTPDGQFRHGVLKRLLSP